MDLSHLRSLVAVSDAGSVTKAAQRLLLTQPAVTRQIRALEREVGTPLFDRTRKPMTLTSAGEAAREEARRILEMTEQFSARIGSGTGVVAGHLMLGISHSLARDVILPVVLAMRRDYPQVELRWTNGWSDALIRAVEEERLHAAIVLLPPRGGARHDLAMHRLVAVPAQAVAAAKTSLKGAVRIEALRDVEWVLSPEGCGYRRELQRRLEDAGLPFTVAVEPPDLELQLHLVRAGVGAGIIPKRALTASLRKSGLQTFRIPGVEFELVAWLVHRRRGPVVAAVIPLVARIAEAVIRAPRGAR